MNSNVKDVIVIGAGSAGLSASIYLKRAGKDVLLIEKEAPGGKLNKMFRIENYPGYTEEEGTTLAYKMYTQIEQLEIELKLESVINLEEDNDLVKVITNKEIYFAKYVILASGNIPKKLKAINAEKYDGKGISYCSICDGALYKNKDVVIVGNGNSAIETAIYLSEIANKVTVISRSDVLKATDKEIEDVSNLKNVDIIYNHTVKEIIGDEKINAIKLDDDNLIETSGIFVMIGQDQNDGYYKNLNIKEGKLGIIVDSKMKTNNDKIYACGDAIDKSLYQVVTAVSEGAIAATSVIEKLRSN